MHLPVFNFFIPIFTKNISKIRGMENYFYSEHYFGFTDNSSQKTPVKAHGSESRNDSTEKGIDLNEQLIRNRQSTFLMRVHSNAMIEAGIHQGDVVIIDRSLEAMSGKIVIAVLDGEMIIRRLDISNYKKRLLPATQHLAPIDINESSAFAIWGVVTFVIHSV